MSQEQPSNSVPPQANPPRLPDLRGALAALTTQLRNILSSAAAGDNSLLDDMRAAMGNLPRRRILLALLGVLAADEAYRKLAPGPFQQGADFAAIVREYSESPESAAKGGELDGWVGESLDALTDLTEHPFHQQVLALQKDEISPPFVYGDSLYIVQVLERSEPQPTTLEQATPLIKDALTDQQHDELLAKLSAQLREQAQLVIYDVVLREIIAAQPPSSTATP